MERAYASSRSSLNLKRGRVVPTLPRGQNLSDIPSPCLARNCTKESFLVGQRNLLDVCAVAVRAAKAVARNETELGLLRPSGEPITFCGAMIAFDSRRFSARWRRSS